MKIKRGDQFSTTVNFKNSDGTVVDITGTTVFFTVKSKAVLLQSNDNNAEIVKKVTSHTDAENGITAIELTSSDTDIATGDYQWEIQIKFANGDILSSSTGLLHVENDLTKRVV